MTNIPLVSVCLPVFNGHLYLREAIASVFNQTWSDWELVVSDNASTDRTSELCRECAATDSRVHYHLADANHGLAWNFNRAFELARGKYVMWLGHDDALAPDYLKECKNALECDADAVLCFSYQNQTDENGSVVSRVAPTNEGDAELASTRFRNLMQLGHGCAAICGLMRRAALAQTGLHGGYYGSDRVLLAEMGLRGRFCLLPQYLFSRRIHPQSTTQRYRSPRERSLVFDPGKTGRLFFPFVLKAQGLFSAVNRTPLPWHERLRCYRQILCWLHAYREKLRWDVQEGLVLSLERYVSVEQVSRLRALKRRVFRHSTPS